MSRFALVVLFSVCLTACGLIDTVPELFKHSQAVETDLEQKVGVRPQVGFNWRNGRLLQVSVTFTHLYEKTPLHELARIVRRSVDAEFQPAAETVTLSFALGKADGTVARAD